MDQTIFFKGNIFVVFVWTQKEKVSTIKIRLTFESKWKFQYVCWQCQCMFDSSSFTSCIGGGGTFTYPVLNFIWVNRAHTKYLLLFSVVWTELQDCYHVLEIKPSCCQTPMCFLTWSNFFQAMFGLFQHKVPLLGPCAVFLFSGIHLPQGLLGAVHPPSHLLLSGITAQMSVWNSQCWGGKITSALHPPREVSQSGSADTGINQSHYREGGQGD